MAFFMYFIDVIRGKNITFVYHKILYNMKEEELIEQMKNGNNIAFAALYDYYCQKVYNFTKLYVTSSDTVAEIVQDVFVKFWEARHLLDNNKKVEGFLFVITRNIIFNMFIFNIPELILSQNLCNWFQISNTFKKFFRFPFT